MADGINIDTLEIEVEASSESAVAKINALTEALKSLQTVTKQKFGDIAKKIDGIGGSASVAQKKVQEKKEIINRATGKASKPVEFDASKAVKGIKGLDKEISNTEKNIARLRAKIETIESAKATAEKPTPELIGSFDAQISKAKEVLKEQFDILSALRSQQNSLRDSLHEGISSMGVSDSFDQVDKDVDKLAEKMKDLASAAEETAQGLDLKKTLRDSLYGDIKERTDAIRDSLRDAKDEFGRFSEFINYAPGIEGLESAQDYAKEIREQFKAATYAAKEAKQEIEQSVNLNQPISDIQIGNFVKAENAIDALKGKYAELQSDFRWLPILPDFSKQKSVIASSVEDFREVKNAASEAKEKIEEIGGEEIKPPDMKALKKALNDLTGASLDGLKRTLASAELQTVKTDGKLAAMRRTLDRLKDTPGFEAVEKDLQDFAARADHAKLYIEDFKKAIDLIEDYKPDLSMPGVAEEIQAVTAELKRLQDEYKAASNTSKIAGETAKNSMADLKAAAKGTKAGDPPGKLDIFKDIKGVLDNIAQKKIGQILPKGAETSIKALSGAFQGLTKSALGFASAHPVVAGAILAIGLAVKAVVGQMQKLASSAFSAAKKGFELLASGARKLAASIKDLLKSGIGNLGKGIAGIGNHVVSGITKPFRNALSAFQKWKSAIGRVAFYRVVREAVKQITDGFKTGMDNLYQYSRLVGTEFAPAMDRLATSSLYLKNSLGAMAAPLIQALAPAIDFIIDKFVSLLNVIGKVFAALTGKSVYTQAKKHAVEYGEAAKNASKATKDFLLGIDELNVINDNAGGAGGAASDFGSMFEEVEVPNDIKDWAGKIREAIENGEWRKVGEIVADKLNEIVDSWDSYAWGARLGELINNGLNVAYGFLTTFDFEQLGRKVADGINGIFDTVDWDLLGRTFAAGWNGLFDFIYGFATKLDWRGIGSSIADAINGAIDEFNFERAAQAISKLVTGIFTTFKTAIRETHWYTLGQELGNFINNIDWYGIIYGALTTITAALDALRMGIDGFLSRWNWQKTAMEVYTAINDAFKSISWGSLGKSIGDGIKTALAFVSTVLDGIEWRDIGNKIGQFIIGLDWVGILAGLANVIVSGINAAIRTVSGLISTIQPHIKEWAKNLGDNFMEAIRKIEWADAGKALSDGIEAALDFMIEFMQTVDWDEVGQHITEFLENIDWDTLLTKWGQLLGEVMSAKMKVIDVSGILEVGANIVKGLWDGWWAEWEAGGGILGWLKREFLEKFLGAIKNLFGIHSPSTVMAEIGGYIVEGLLQGLSDTWHVIYDFFTQTMPEWWDKYIAPWFTLEKWSELVSSIGTSIKNAWSETVTQWATDISAWWDTHVAPWFTLEKWAGIAKSIKDSIITSLSDTVKQWKTDITSWWSENVAPWFKLEKWTTLVKTIKDSIIDSLKNTVTQWKTDIKNWWDEHVSPWFTFEKWSNTVKSIKDSIITSLGDAVTKWKTDIKNWWDNDVSPWFTLEKWKELGENALEGLFSGLSNIGGKIWTWGGNLVAGVKDFFGIHSPSTLFRDQIGLNMGLGIAKGINNSESDILSSLSDITKDMKNQLNGMSFNIEPVQPQYAVRQNPYAAIPASFAQAQSAGASISNYSSTTTNVSNDNSDMVSALYAVAETIVEAINSNGDRPISIDGKTLMQSVERAQRQRGANIMGGGVLG